MSLSVSYGGSLRVRLPSAVVTTAARGALVRGGPIVGALLVLGLWLGAPTARASTFEDPQSSPETPVSERDDGEPLPAPAGSQEGQLLVVDGEPRLMRGGRLYRLDDPALFEDDAAAITVTASRVEGRSASSRTETISSAAIAEAGARTLADVLEEQAGIQVNSSMGLGQEVQLDGLDGRHVLVLIDGRPVTGRVNNRIDVGRLPVSAASVERIEIVRGPMSALHGSEALGGVVNIITKRPALDPGGEVELGTQVVSGGVWRTLGLHGRGGAGPVAVRVDVNGSDLPGIDRDQDGRGDMPDRRQLGVHAEAALALSDAMSFRAQVDGSLADAVSRTSSAAPFADRARNEEWSAAALLEADVFDDGILALDVRVDRFRHRFDKLPAGGEPKPPSFCRDGGLPFDPPCPAAPDPRTDAVQDESRLELRLTDPIARGHALAEELTPAVGAVVTRQRARRINGDGDDTLPGGGDRLQLSAYGELMWRPLTWLSLVPGARVEQALLDGAIPGVVHGANGASGPNGANGSPSGESLSAFGPKVAVRIDGPVGMALRASYGRGFRLPSFEERLLRFDHSELGYIVEGNPALRPERSHGARAEVLWQPGPLFSVAVEGALNLLEDLIVEDPVSTREGVALFTYRNAAYAQTSTVTTRLSAKPVEGLELDVTYQYLLAAVDTSACPADNPWFCADEQVRSLPLRAAHALDANLRWRVRATSTVVFARLDALSERPVDVDADGQTVGAPAFAVASLGVRQPMGTHAELMVGLENLFDQYDARYGPKPGRHASVNLRLWQ